MTDLSDSLIDALVVFLHDHQTPRNAAEGRRVLPEAHPPDEVSVCVLLLQPPLHRQRAHGTQVCYCFSAVTVT